MHQTQQRFAARQRIAFMFRHAAEMRGLARHAQQQVMAEMRIRAIQQKMPVA